MPLHSETARRETFTWSSSILHAVVVYILIWLFFIWLILGIVNFRLHCHQYFYRGSISSWLPTKARDSPATNSMLQFSSSRVVYKVGVLKHFAHWQIFWPEVLRHFMPKIFQYLSLKYAPEVKWFNNPNLSTTWTHFYNSSINIGSIFFPRLLTHTNNSIYWDATLQALILHLISF